MMLLVIGFLLFLLLFLFLLFRGMYRTSLSRDISDQFIRLKRLDAVIPSAIASEITKRSASIFSVNEDDVFLRVYRQVPEIVVNHHHYIEYQQIYGNKYDIQPLLDALEGNIVDGEIHLENLFFIRGSNRCFLK